MNKYKYFKVALGKRYIQTGNPIMIIHIHGSQQDARDYAVSLGYTVSGVKTLPAFKAMELSMNGILTVEG